MQAFFMSAHIVQPYTGIRVPPCTGLMAVQHFSMNVIDSGTGTDTFCFYYVTIHRDFQRRTVYRPRNVSPRNGHEPHDPHRESLRRPCPPGAGPARLPHPLPPTAQCPRGDRYRHLQHQRHRLHHGGYVLSPAHRTRLRQVAGEASLPPPVPRREAPAELAVLHRPTSGRCHPARLPFVSGRITLLSHPRGCSPTGAARDGYTPNKTTIYQPNNNRTL